MDFFEWTFSSVINGDCSNNLNKLTTEAFCDSRDVLADKFSCPRKDEAQAATQEMDGSTINGQQVKVNEVRGD